MKHALSIGVGAGCDIFRRFDCLMTKRKRMIRVFLLLGLMVFCAPYLVGLGFFTKKIETKLQQSGVIKPNVGRVAWSWFPVPHVSLRDTRLVHDVGQITIGAIDVFPDMGELFKGNLVIGSVGIVSPEISVTSLDDLRAMMHATPENDDTPKKSILFKPITVTVDDGRVELPWNGSLAALGGKIPALTLSDIRMTLASTPAHMTISGSFRSSYSDECDMELTLENAPDRDWGWDLAIRVKAVNLDPIRAILIQMFADNDQIKRVCGDIIRSGHIRDGEFRFTGKTSEWTDLNRMIVTAEVDQASIHIPRTELFLERTSGSIRIERSLLTGNHLTVSLGKSVGRNGSFVLGLGHGDRRFGLDVDMTADLSELPAVLDEFISHTALRKELSGIKDLQGRANVHLTLGETLNDITVHVSARDIDASCFYQRINEPVVIRSGTLEINPESVAWTNLTGSLGSSVIHNTSGSISWGKDVILNVSSLEAGLNTQDVYHYLSLDKDLGPRIQSVMSGISGILDIRDFTLNGRENCPESLSFKGVASSTTLALDSPRLPQGLELISPGLSFSRDAIHVEELTARMGNQAIRLSGSVDHLLDEDFTGKMNVYGTVSPLYADWIRKQGWIPEAVFPRLPCTLAPLTLSWAKDEMTISGTIHHTDDQGRQITTKADVGIHQGETQIRKLSITTHGDKAELTATLPGNKHSDDLVFDFQGKLKGQTLDGMLEKQGRPSGDISGTFHFVYPQTSQGRIQLDGQADLEHVKLDVSNQGMLIMDQGLITGKTDSAELDLTNLSFTRSPLSTTKGLTKITVPQMIGSLSFLPNKQSRLMIRSANVCGLHVDGQVDLPLIDMDLHFNTEKDKTLRFEEFFACLGISQARISGDLTVDGSVKGTPTMIRQGAFVINASHGVILQDPLLPRILALLDLTELFSANQVKNLMADGYRYDSIEITGTITGHNIHITRAKVIGAGINFFATGYIDLGTQSLDLLVLASPFKTVDSLINHIPVIGKILGGKNKSILSVPVKVEGTLSEPRTRILPKSLSTVSSGIIDVFVYTFKLPFELSYDLVNGKTEKTSAPAQKP